MNAFVYAVVSALLLLLALGPATPRAVPEHVMWTNAILFAAAFLLALLSIIAAIHSK